MLQEKLNISWDDLSARRVDNRLREQSAMERNRAYAQLQEESVPAPTSRKPRIWHNAVVVMTMFGILGGLLAWGAFILMAGPLTPMVGSLLHYNPSGRADADARLAEIQRIELSRITGRFDSVAAQIATEEVRSDANHNPYFRVLTQTGLSDKARRVKLSDLETNDRFAAFVINVISYGLCGMMIAMCLAIAEPISQHKARAAFMNSLAGAVMGILGGVAAALLTDRISHFAGAMTQGQAGWVQKLVSQSAAWATLGLFLGLGSGLVLRSAKKTAVGIGAGFLGGLIGGALFDPVQRMSHNPLISELVALVAIGLLAGLATGLLENVVKAGWLKVTSGIIAGKQFILYRNPTYIGSSPDCQIYLFKDPQVGRRHAAVHLLPTGIEIEDLPLGGPTQINGQPIQRTKLKNGDVIEIGATSFRFQEKRPKSGN